jgi:hypothetical protein
LIYTLCISDADWQVPWETSFPISLTDATDTANPGNVHLHAANGTTLRVMVVPPGTGSGMHRTATLDYGEWKSLRKKKKKRAVEIQSNRS